MSVIGAELTRWTAAVALSLAVAGFVAGLLPRLGALAAAMQMPLLMSFAYSAGQPLSDAAALDRGLAVLLAMPIFVVAAALAFQVDQRRPLVLGAAQTLGALAMRMRRPRRRRGEAAAAALSPRARRRAAAASTATIARACALGVVRGDRGEESRRRAGQPEAGGMLRTLRRAEATAATLAGLARSARAGPARRRPTAQARRRPRPRSKRSARRPATPASTPSGCSPARGTAPPRPRCSSGVADAELPARGGTLPSPARQAGRHLDVEDPTFRRAVRLGVAAGFAGLAAAAARARAGVLAGVLGRRDLQARAPRATGAGHSSASVARSLGLFVALGLIELVGTSQARGRDGGGLALLWPGSGADADQFRGRDDLRHGDGGADLCRRRDRRRFVSYRVEDTLRRRGDRGRDRTAAVAPQAARLVRRGRADGARVRAAGRCGRWPDPPPPRSTILSRSWRAYARSPRRARQRPRRPRCRRRRQPPARNSPRWRPPPADTAERLEPVRGAQPPPPSSRSSRTLGAFRTSRRKSCIRGIKRIAAIVQLGRSGRQRERLAQWANGADVCGKRQGCSRWPHALRPAPIGGGEQAGTRTRTGELQEAPARVRAERGTVGCTRAVPRAERWLDLLLHGPRRDDGGLRVAAGGDAQAALQARQPQAANRRDPALGRGRELLREGAWRRAGRAPDLRGAHLSRPLAWGGP